MGVGKKDDFKLFALFIAAPALVACSTSRIFVQSPDKQIPLPSPLWQRNINAQ